MTDRHARLSRFRSFDGPASEASSSRSCGAWPLLIAVIVAVQVAGSIAYALTESVSIWQGFLFTLDTVATVGSDPTRRTSAGQIVKVLLIVLGVGTLFYALVTVTEFFVAGHLGEILEERRTLKQIEASNRPPPDLRLRPRRPSGRPRPAGRRRRLRRHRRARREQGVADQMGAPFLHGRPPTTRS